MKTIDRLRFPLLLLCVVARPAGAADGGTCNTLLTAADVASTCGVAGVTVNLNDRDAGDLRSFEERRLAADRVDLTRCAKKFQGPGNRSLMLTIAKIDSRHQNRVAFDTIKPMVAGLADYAPLADIGDGARRFSSGGVTGPQVQAIEFIRGRWSVSLRTADGTYEGERFERLCGFPEMERLARILASRLP